MTAIVHEISPTTLPAPPERVFAALTDPAQLRAWFAEHALVEPRVGGAYRFWGKHTYGTPARDEAGQTLTRYEPGRAIAYDWTIDGVATQVTLELAAGESDGSTVVTGTHRFEHALAMPRAAQLVDDLWRLHFGSLMTYLGGSEPMRPDFGDPKPRVELSIGIDAPRERVFRALLEPARLNRWIASAASVEARAGGACSYGWKYKVGEREVLGGPTEILEYVENERLVTDWPDWRGDPDGPLTTVTWLLEGSGGTTRVTLVHGVFPRTADISDYGAGWGYFLGKLKSTVEEAGD